MKSSPKRFAWSPISNSLFRQTNMKGTARGLLQSGKEAFTKQWYWRHGREMVTSSEHQSLAPLFGDTPNSSFIEQQNVAIRIEIRTDYGRSRHHHRVNVLHLDDAIGRLSGGWAVPCSISRKVFVIVGFAGYRALSICRAILLP